MQNIVPFIGKRGSGKTSAMMSFANSLREYRESEESLIGDALRSSCEHAAVKFTVLESIDGSLLERGENIFKIVLAQLFAEYENCKKDDIAWKNEQYEFERRALLQAFDRVYRSSCKLEEEESSNYEESSLASLKNISNSLTLKSEFDNMIQKFLSFSSCVEKEGSLSARASEQFLVVVIDDIDMNIENGFDMLEKIHRYMMVRNVIVLLALDYDQMKTLCQHRFYEMVPKYDLKLKEKDADVERLAQEYLDKVMPANERVYIPSLNKASDLVIANPDDFDGEPGKSLKETVFSLLYLKFGMRLDVMGSKRHFYEQNSLRSFVNFYLMLDGMEDIIQADYAQVEKAFEKNYKVLMSDTTTRMVNERLSSWYTQSFHRITEIGMPHSMRNLYFEMIKMEEMFGEESGIAFLPDLKENLEHFGYSYGEVLRIIYCWGRVDGQSKEMIRCLLAFYSLELSYCYNEYCLAYVHSDGSRISEARSVLADVLNGSVAGSWANRMLPKVKLNMRQQVAGARSEVNMEAVFRFQIQFQKNKFDGGSLVYSDVVGDKLEEMRKLFRTVTLLAMFFEQKHYKVEYSLSWDLASPEQSDEEAELRKLYPELSPNQDLTFYCSGGVGTYNVFGFVANQLEYEEYYGPLWKNLFIFLFGESEKEKFNDFMDGLGIADDFAAWYEYAKGLAFPIYDIDLCYNIMKRLRQKDTAKLEMNMEDLLPRIRNLFDFIEARLRENDNWYKDSMGELFSFENYENRRKEARIISYKDSYRISYADAFKNCPFVKWIQDDKYLYDGFNQLFIDMFQRMVNSENSKIPHSLGGGNEIHGYDD